jgi:hypothetical protein
MNNPVPKKITFRFCTITNPENYYWDKGELKVKDAVYRIDDTGVELTEPQFKKLQSLLYPQGIVLSPLYPPWPDDE